MLLDVCSMLLCCQQRLRPAPTYIAAVIITGAPLPMTLYRPVASGFAVRVAFREWSFDAARSACCASSGFISMKREPFAQREKDSRWPLKPEEQKVTQGTEADFSLTLLSFVSCLNLVIPIIFDRQILSSYRSIGYLNIGHWTFNARHNIGATTNKTLLVQW